MSSPITAEKLYEQVNELVLNDEFEQALSLYDEAIRNETESSDSAQQQQHHKFTCLVGRSQVHMKLHKPSEALRDADEAIKLNSEDTRGYLRKGAAQYSLKQYQAALESFQQGQLKVEASEEAKKTAFADWIRKCDKELAKVAPKTQPSAEATTPVVTQPPAIKYEWYQSESNVTVSILAKGVSADHVTISTTENSLNAESNEKASVQFAFKFSLYGQIVPDQTQIKYLSTKVEIKLKKSEAVSWKTLEGTPIAVAKVVESISKKPEYPSSSKKPKNWDRIAADVTAEEKDEKLEGDAALNKLFQQVYSSGNDETRKAMNKSFMESGGTVLSTNWSDIGAKKTEIKAPDGMEWKKWD